MCRTSRHGTTWRARGSSGERTVTAETGGSVAGDGRKAGGRLARTGRRLAALPCGRRTKYLVLVFWVLVIAATGSLAGKLQGAEKNDASAYLPPSAESTQELNAQAAFVS